jgi:hypothetical protein
MQKFILSLCLVILAVASAHAQQLTVEKGKAEELKGVATVYLNTDAESYRMIVKEVSKHLPGLSFTNKPEEAQAWLVFSVQKSKYSKGDPTSALTASRVSSVTEDYEFVATGTVVIPVAKDRVRKLLDFKDTSQSIIQNKLSTNFARAFVRMYQKANEGAKRE